MKCIWYGFVLLNLATGTLFAAESSNCTGNNFKNDPSLFPKLNGYLYNLYTTVAYADNELFKLDPKGNGSIYARTTNDGDCCRTLNIMFGNEYNGYDIDSDDDCPTKLSENSGQIKLLSSNTDDDSSTCIILWNCRKSREGVQTLCDKRDVSLRQKIWIHGQYIMRRLPILKIEQTTDYNDGKCFKN